MTPLEGASKQIMLVHSLPLLRQRARIHWIPVLCAVLTFAYVTYWLLHHSFTQEPHHYITALVITGWIASLPFLFLYRFIAERSNHHGIL